MDDNNPFGALDCRTFVAYLVIVSLSDLTVLLLMATCVQRFCFGEVNILSSFVCFEPQICKAAKKITKTARSICDGI